jgi:hypothetical protein
MAMPDNPAPLSDRNAFLIGLAAAALSGALIGMVAGACGAVLAVIAWSP